MGTYTTETIVIKDPSQELLSLIGKMQEHKRKLREELSSSDSLFTIQG